MPVPSLMVPPEPAMSLVMWDNHPIVQKVDFFCKFFPRYCRCDRARVRREGPRPY